MSRHNEAFERVSVALPGLTDKQSLVLRAVSEHETNYGKGWKGAGEGSNNMGAITMAPIKSGPEDGNCPPNGFKNKDSRRDLETGKIIQYTTCFRKYPTPDDGFIGTAKVLFKPNVLNAISLIDLHGVAAAMRENSYYLGTAPTREQQIDEYHSALKNAIKNIVADTHEINVFESVDDNIHVPPVIPPVIPPVRKSITPLVVGSVLIFGMLLTVSNIKSWQVKTKGAH